MSPAPDFAPRLPSTPRISEENVAPANDPRFPSFTMNSDFFAAGDAEDLHDITNEPQHAAHHAPTAAKAHRDKFSMPRPWDRPMDTGKISAAPPVSQETRQRSRQRGKAANPVVSVKPPRDEPGNDDEVDDDDLDDLCDIPTRLTIGPGAAAARLDLQRCTLRVHKQLVHQLQTNSMKPGAFSNQHFGDFGHGAGMSEEDSGDGLSRAQGELFLKSRFPLKKWRRRYGSIVDHAYFGPVLFLFKYDARGDVSLHHSMMIVLADSNVRLGKNSTSKEGGYRCEFLLKTTRRKYQLAANHTMRRDYWIRNLEAIQVSGPIQH